MNERELLAAEHALGLLEGEALLEARGMVASDVEFARSVEAWEQRLAPMLDEIGEATPPAALWNRIRSALAEVDVQEGNVIALRRRLGFWKGLSAAATAIAASLALVVAYQVTRPPPAPVAPAAQAPVMVASLMSEDKTMILSAAFRSEDNSLMLMPGEMAPAPGRSHELWIIPADGTPRSLGLVGAGEERMAVDPAMAPHFADAATLAVSVEPEGGSPGDVPTGPVIATGQLHRV